MVAAVDRYTDIPASVRDRLKARMASRAYDEVVSIRRDAIVGRAHYGAAIKDMHFAGGRVCTRVDRAAWAADAQERGLVYCESGECILVPTVCRNVSRIERRAPAVAGAAAASSDGGSGAGGGAGAGAAVAPASPSGALAAQPSAGANPLAGESAGGSGPTSLADGGSPAISPAAADDSFVAALADRQVAAASSEPAAGWPLAPTQLTQQSSGTGLVDRDGLRWTPASGSGGGATALQALSPVPEPGSWTLMLAGLAVLAGLARHRRKTFSPA